MTTLLSREDWLGQLLAGMEDEYRYVLVSPELVEILSKEWSAPVEVQIRETRGKVLELTFRATRELA